MVLSEVVSAALTIYFLIQSAVNYKHNINVAKFPESFEVAYSWAYVNFTWPSSAVYEDAFTSQRYVPANNGFSGIKYYNDRLYVSLPRWSAGTPVTLASFPVASSKVGPLLEPYPSWEMNVQQSCTSLQNVQSMEIDTKGVMWVLDGTRITSGLTICPPKIVLLDMKRNGMVLQTFVVPTELTPLQGWLNDLVIDESDGGYAYISEASSQDPGIIVYSRQRNTGWKFRDCSFFAEMGAAGFTVKGIALNTFINVNGIALAPSPKSISDDRLFYYGQLTGYSLYALSTRILKNESLSSTSNWRAGVQYIGRKSTNVDGMIFDNRGYLYYGLIPTYGIARWNANSMPFDQHAEAIYQDYVTVDWPDSFCFDDKGYLYFTADQSERNLNTSNHPPPVDGVRYRILKRYTGTNSYLYS